MKPIFTSVPKASWLLGIGMTKTNELIASGVLRSAKIGARRLVVVESVEELAANLMAEQANDNIGGEVL